MTNRKRRLKKKQKEFQFRINICVLYYNRRNRQQNIYNMKEVAYIFVCIPFNNMLKLYKKFFKLTRYIMEFKQFCYIDSVTKVFVFALGTLFRKISVPWNGTYILGKKCGTDAFCHLRLLRVRFFGWSSLLHKFYLHFLLTSSSDAYINVYESLFHLSIQIYRKCGKVDEFVIQYESFS